MKKFLKVLFYIILSTLVFVILFYIFTPLLNNYRLSTFANQLTHSSFPQSTMQIETKTVCGKLNGNGNGMDFLVCVLIKSDLSLDALKHSYDAMTFKTAKNEENHKVTMDVLPVNGDTVQTNLLEHGTLKFDSLKNTVDYSNYYIVLLYDGGYPADFDIRGH